MSEPYRVNSPVELSVTFSAPNDEGDWVPADPTDVAFLATSPNGGSTSLTYLVGQIERHGVGRFTVSLNPTVAGLWFYRWTASGALSDVQEGSLEVESAWVPSASYRSLATLVADVRAELSQLDSTSFTDAQINRLLNDGQAMIKADRAQSDRLVWGDGSESLELPDDLVRFGDLVAPVALPAYTRHGKTLFFSDPPNVTAGTALLHYYAQYPEMDEAQPCALPDPGATGCVAYAAWRLLKRVCANRSVYERFATQLGTNGVTSEDIERLADLHHQEFLDVKEDLSFSDEEAPAYS